MSHKIFRLVTILFLALALSFSGFTSVLAAPPTNDNFADAEAMGALPFTATADITNATNEQDEPQSCFLMVRTVWYSFTPTETMAVRVDTSGSAVSGNVNIYLSSGSGISDLSLLACAANNSGSFNFIAEAGKTYYLQAGFGIIQQVGAIQINLDRIFPPANDNFANAEVIASLPFNTSIDISNATSETGEPIGCSKGGTVWYSFTPSETMTVRVDTSGSPITGHVNVYLSLGTGISDLSFLGCSINGETGISEPFSFDVEAGKTYYLRAGSTNGEAGSVPINLEKISQSENQVIIDIKPGSQTNPINPGSSGKIPVAILSTPDFNAPSEVNRASLTFGSTGNEHSLVSCNKKGTDVNGDGLKDLMCHFKTKLAGFKFGDTEGILKGQTLGGVSIEARDVVRVLQASYP